MKWHEISPREALLCFVHEVMSKKASSIFGWISQQQLPHGTSNENQKLSSRSAENGCRPSTKPCWDMAPSLGVTQLEVKKAFYLITSLGMNRHVAVLKPKHSAKQKICIWETGAYLKQQQHSACCQGTKLQGHAVCYFRYHELKLQGTWMACQTCAEGKTECCLQTAGRSAWSLDNN